MSPNQVRMIVNPLPVILDRSAVAHRLSPRPVEKRQPEYDERFDSDTLFFDIFNSDRGIELVGPPLLNLRDYFENGSVTDSSGRVLVPSFRDIDRTQDSFVECDSPLDSLTFANKLVQETYPVNESYTHLFEDRYSLVTLSKNNSLSWIKEWVEFHVINHGVDAVLFYDNNSEDYAHEDIVHELSGISGLAVVVVVPWPFKYGPQGGTWEGSVPAPWDSDFCQHGAINHARRRFLSSAAGVINADIDELVVLDDGGNVFEKLALSGASALSYTGRWIEAIRGQSDTVPSFADFHYSDRRSTPCTRKWTASPMRMPEAVQWRTHEIVGADLLEVSDVAHRHFKGINSDWKYARTTPPKFDAETHVADEVLQRYLENTYAGNPHRVSAPEPSRMRDLAGSATTLQQVESDFIFESKHLGFIVKTWYWKPTCLVIEINYFGLRLGIDLTNTDTGIQMKIIGRDGESKALLRNLLKDSPPNNMSPSGHWKVRSWPRTISASIIAKEIRDILQKGTV